MISQEAITIFQQVVLDYYHENQRNLPWRQPESDGHFDAYKIMVSEVMLQQTQVSRVIEKYIQFLEVFPTVNKLASANLNDVLVLWQGLGYNRRARFLREAALKVRQDHDGVMPLTLAGLIELPGIGHNTASAILVYAENTPLGFIETNVRTVYIHHFFEDAEAVTDKQILELVGLTLYRENPREWYWALMDYGTYLKSQVVNPSRRSKHYVKQSRFKGSVREMRGEILRILNKQPLSVDALQLTLNDQRFDAAYQGLVKDGLITEDATMVRIAD